MKKLPIELVFKTCDMISDYLDISMSVDQCSALIEANPELRKDLLKFESPSDTCTREMVMSILSQKFMGRDWPTYGDAASEKLNMIKFIDEFTLKANKFYEN